jgi:hypothetical protein
LGKAQGKQEGKPLLKDRNEEEVRGYCDALAKKGVISLKRGNKDGNKFYGTIT